MWSEIRREALRLASLMRGKLAMWVRVAIAVILLLLPSAVHAQAEKRFALTPQHTVFIDDRAENISAACTRGWHGIVHADYPRTLAALRALEVSC